MHTRDMRAELNGLDSQVRKGEELKIVKMRICKEGSISRDMRAEMA